MYSRVCNLPKRKSFFLFGARGTGKSTLLESRLRDKSFLWLDFLDVNIEATYQRNPMTLYEQLSHSKPDRDKPWVVIDEIQKVPKLLDVIHKLIESTEYLFALSGSSARKLRRGSANLLAGRAFERFLFPLLPEELVSNFDLVEYLQRGGLPSLFSLDPNDRDEYLKTYANTYLREEVQAEQLVRKMDPFRLFLEVAGQSSGHLINYSKMASDIGSDPVSIKNYFQILEDTLLGFYLPPFHRSIRKRQGKTPKFYLFDLGVLRAIERKLDIPVREGTSDFGRYFEHAIIGQIHALNSYHQTDWRLSFFNTKDDVEIDLILDKPGKPTTLIEIKSTDQIQLRHLKHLKQIGQDIENSRKLCLSRDKNKRVVDGVECWPWFEGIQSLFA